MNSYVGKSETGKPFLALVLEPGNLTRLREGKPIQVRIEDWFPEGMPKHLVLLIAFSETPIADARQLAKQAEVTLDERTHVSQAKRPHCPECKSTIEQFGAMRGEAPISAVWCPQCGCTLGVVGRDVLEVKTEG
jgi:hypothetical protein